MTPPFPRPDDLGIHAAFLRRLARNLLRSPDLAEDAVQETLVLAWKKRPDGPHPRGWLAGTLRNVTRNLRRGASRRANHEGRPPRHQAASPEAIRARERLRKELLDAVLALPDLHREVVLLRFDQGLPPRKIAAALGVPVHTVHNRLRSGLARLRTQLAATQGTSNDENGGWRGALAALIPQLTPTTAGLWGLGGLLMSKLLWTSAAALALLVVGWIALDPLADSDAPEAVRTAGETRQADADPGDGDATLRGRDTAAPDPAAAPVDGPRMIHGIVRHAESGAPVPGAAVRAFEYARLRVLETVTGDDGRFAFEATRDAPGAFHVRAGKDGLAHADALRVRVRARPLELRLEAGGTLAGVVTVPAGGIPSGLRARTILRRPRADSGNRLQQLVGAVLPGSFHRTADVEVDPETGRFEIGPLAPGLHAIELVEEGQPPFLVVPPDQPYRWEAGYTVESGQRVDVGEVELRASATLRVRLIDAATEEVVRRATFAAYAEGDGTSERTPIEVADSDEQGIFHVPATNAGKGRLSLNAIVESPGFANADIDVSGTWGTRPLVIRLHRPGAMVVRVVPEGWREKRGVAFVRRSSDENVLGVQAFDVGQAFAFEDLPAGERIELLVLDAGIDARRHMLGFTLQPGERRHVELGGPNRTAVEGTVRLGGQPMADVLVAVDDVHDDRVRIWTGQDGRFRVDGLAPGMTTVFFNLGEQRAMVERRIELVEGKAHDASVDLVKAIVGRIEIQEAPDPPKPTKGAKDTVAYPELLFRDAAGLEIGVRPSSDGSFSTWLPGEGTYEVLSDDNDFYVISPVKFEAKPDDRARVTVTVGRDPGDGLIVLKAVDAETGAPVIGVSASYSARHMSGMSTERRGGEVHLDDQHLGPYVIRLGAPKYVSEAVRVDLTLEKRKAEVRVRLARSQAVRITSFQPGSRGQLAGLEAGDLLRSYGGRPVTDLAALRTAMQGKATTALIPVTILRGSQELTLDLPGGRLGIFVANARVPR